MCEKERERLRERDIVCETERDRERDTHTVCEKEREKLFVRERDR